MIQKNCLVIATSLGATPGRITEALSKNGTPSTTEAHWHCFTSAAAAREWATAKGIVIDGKRYIIAPHIPANARAPMNSGELDQ